LAVPGCRERRIDEVAPEIPTEPISRNSPSLKREVEKEDVNLRGAIDRIVLSHAIEELPRGCRQIFELHEGEGYEHHEIAEQLQCSIGNSKSQLGKAKNEDARPSISAEEPTKLSRSPGDGHPNRKV
jgi:RNA polymerase sigma-70 factor (ECF subfamily)